MWTSGCVNTTPITNQSSTIQTILPTTVTPTTISIQNPEPQRIYFSSSPSEFPVQQLPPRLDLYGSSSLIKGQPTVTFAYIEGSAGGTTQEFNVPYPLWTMNISVMPNVNQTEVWFQIGLFYASNGTFIDGGELLHRGSMYKTIYTSNSKMYIIIDTNGRESYRINFETAPKYYDYIHNLGINTDITRF